MEHLKSIFTPLLASVLFAGSVNADLVMIASKNNPLSSATKGDVTSLFTGRTKEIGGVVLAPVVLKTGPSHEQLLKDYLAMNEQQFTREWSKLVFTGKAKNPERAEDEAGLVKAVAGDKSKVGFVDKASVTDEVKVIPLS